MGGNNSKLKATQHEDEYLRMLKRRRDRTAEMHQKESHMQGKAYQELKKQGIQQNIKRQSNSELKPAASSISSSRNKSQVLNTFTDAGCGGSRSQVSGMYTNKTSLSKSPMRGCQNPQIQINRRGTTDQQQNSSKTPSDFDDVTGGGGGGAEDQGMGRNARTTSTCAFSQDIYTNNIVRIQPSSATEGDLNTGKKKGSFHNREALNDPNLEWVAAMLSDLEALDDNIYKEAFKQRIDKMLGSFTINMDPSNYRRLYRDKAFREAINLPQAQQQTSFQNQGTSQNGNTSLYNVRASLDLSKITTASGIASSSDPAKSPMRGSPLLHHSHTLKPKQFQNMTAPVSSLGGNLQEIFTNPQYAQSPPVNPKYQSVRIITGGEASNQSSQVKDNSLQLIQSFDQGVEQAFNYSSSDQERSKSHVQNQVIYQGGGAAAGGSTAGGQRQPGSGNAPKTGSTNPQTPMLTNEEKTLRHFMEHDIVGLSIFSASSHSKYSMKINSLRQHLASMDDHPIVKLKDFFREILLAYVKKQSEAISNNLSFYEINQTRAAMADQNKKLFEKVVKEIKSFVTLIHDAVVRFYILDIKVGFKYKQNEHLTNLLTSLVLKNPVYSEVHAVIRLSQRIELEKIVTTTSQIRKKYGRSLEEHLKIDPIAIGQTIYRQKQEKELSQQLAEESQNQQLAQIAERPNEEGDMLFDSLLESQKVDEKKKPCDERMALDLFRKLLKKFENVRNVSSPVLKLITIHRVMGDVMAAISGAQNSGPHEADNLIVTIFYILVMLQSSEAKFLGSRFIDECTYIDSFMHEDQIGLIEEYTNIEHIKCVLSELQRGMRKCEKMFIEQASEGSSSESRSSRSESGTTLNTLDQHCSDPLQLRKQMESSDISLFGTLATFDGGLITNESIVGTQQSNSSFLVPSPSKGFVEPSSQTSSNLDQQYLQQRLTPEQEAVCSSEGLSVLQKLQKEGLFTFKNMPNLQVQKHRSQQYMMSPADAMYNNMTVNTNQKSFIEEPSSPTYDGQKNPHGGSTFGSGSELMASRSTKASTLTGSSNTGTLLNAKSTLGSSSPTSPRQHKQANVNLDVIEEELMIEEGCDNELENNRVTLQRIRKESQNHQNDDELSNQYKRCTITDSELQAVQNDDLENNLYLEDQFDHLEQQSQGS